MRALAYGNNPIAPSYNGDTVNVRELQNFCTNTSNNFRELENSVVTLEQSITILNSRMNATNHFIEWVEKHSPETLQAYKAYNTVTHAFDKAQQYGGEAMAETGGS